jgi:hypothetical protein
MYMPPVGIVNAADPDAAYAEAIDIAGAHQSSYGREAAGVMAAAVAAAMAPGAAVDDVVEAAIRVAHDGTRSAVVAVVAEARRQAGPTANRDGSEPGPSWSGALAALRDAIEPYDTVGPDYREPGLAARRPSRLHAIEELPVALGLLVVTGGAYRDAVLAATNYGRDSDSIATMAGALAGALAGPSVIPEAWRRTVAAASQLDLEAPGREMAAVAAELLRSDAERHRARLAAFDALTTDAERAPHLDPA